MNVINHPSANYRLDPIAEAFVLRFDQARLCTLHQQNSPRSYCATTGCCAVAFRLITLSTVSNHLQRFKSP